MEMRYYICAFGDDRRHGQYLCPSLPTYQVSSMYSIQNSGYLICLLLANQNRYANEVSNMCICWWQTTWVALMPITTHIPSFINVPHTELRIFDLFVISQSEQICKWDIKYAHLVTTDHMGSTCAYHYPHTKFHWCSQYRTLDIWLFCYQPIRTDMQMRY